MFKKVEKEYRIIHPYCTRTKQKLNKDHTLCSSKENKKKSVKTYFREKQKRNKACKKQMKTTVRNKM